MAEVNWKKHIVTFLIVFLIAGLIAVQYKSCGMQRKAATVAATAPDARVVELQIGRWHLYAEVADTEQKRRKGLQGRDMLEPNYGMLFVLPEDSRPSFWMKGTKILLSIAFVDSEGRIVQIEKGQPWDATRIKPEVPCKYVLEIRQGWFEERGLGPGARTNLPEALRAEGQ